MVQVKGHHQHAERFPGFTVQPADHIIHGQGGRTDVVITWSSISNGVYRVQYESTPAGTTWTTGTGCNRYRQHHLLHGPVGCRLAALLPSPGPVNPTYAGVRLDGYWTAISSGLGRLPEGCRAVLSRVAGGVFSLM